MPTPQPQPIVLTSGANPTPGVAPKPFVIVGPSTLVTRQPAVANQAAAATLADLAAAQTAINAVTTKLNATLAALRAAGVIAP